MQYDIYIYMQRCVNPVPGWMDQQGGRLLDLGGGAGGRGGDRDYLYKLVVDYGD